MQQKTSKFNRFFGKKSIGIVHIGCQLFIIVTLTASVLSTFVFEIVTIDRMITHIILCVAALLLTDIPMLLEKRFKLYIPSFVQITITLFIIAHFILGEICRLYDSFFLFDKILHTISGIIIALLGFSLVDLLNKSGKMHSTLSPFFVAFFSFCLAITIACVWEIFEFGMDSMFGSNMQRWQDSFTTATINGEEVQVLFYGQGSGIIDTMADIIVCAVGALAVSIAGYVLLKKGSKRIDGILLKSFKNPEQATERALETNDISFLNRMRILNTNSIKKQIVNGGTETKNILCECQNIAESSELDSQIAQIV